MTGIRLSIFDIPIILDSIGPCLTNRQLLQCIRVNKTWACHFLPFLYSSLYFCDERYNQHTTIRNVIVTSLQPNIHRSNLAYAQKIETESTSDYLWYQKQQTPDESVVVNSFPRLRSLGLFWFNLGSEKTERVLPKVVHFLEGHPGLRRLELCFGKASDSVYSDVVTAIKHHPGLQHLRFVYNINGDSTQICQVFESILNLESFEMRLWGPDMMSKPVLANLCRQILKNLEMPKLKHLTLNVENEVMDNAILSSLIPCCPNLESLMLATYGLANQSNPDALSMEALSSLVRNHCPGLKKLKFGVRKDDTLELIKACTVGLESLEIEIVGLIPTPLMSVLLPNHTRTLTSLIIKKPFGPDPETLLDIMCSCSNLRTLNVYINQESRPSDATETHGESLNRRMQRTWVCLDLEDLKLEYSYGYGHIPSSDGLELDYSFRDRKTEVGDGSLLDRYFEYVFTQIGRLTRMKSFEYVGWQKLMVLEKGHLSKLAGLRNMQTVYLSHTQEGDARWMAENWPMLVNVNGFGKRASRNYLSRWKPDLVFR
ncbi:hypothetical protein BG004_000986 [Podila humilis]|nr:hypothetical protein BG004_000986 [Podila humilis]